MTAKRFEIQYNVEPSKLTFKPHYSGVYEVACVGPYAVYRHIKKDDYTVSRDGSVCHWGADLSQYLL